MEKRSWIKRNWLEILLGLSIALTFASPILFTRHWIWPFAWPKVIEFGSDTGPIGDTIGGLTAPIIGIFNAILLYLTLRKQNEQMLEQKFDSDFNMRIGIIRTGIDSLSLKIDTEDKDLLSSVGGIHKGNMALITATIIFDPDADYSKVKISPTYWIDLITRCDAILFETEHLVLRNLVSHRSNEEKVFTYNYVLAIVGAPIFLHETFKRYNNISSKKIDLMDLILNMEGTISRIRSLAPTL